MNFKSGFLLLICIILEWQEADAQPSPKNDLARWKAQASRTEIIRDQWGIPHVYGKSDADAVFGLIYAQCEDDFARVEMNYIEKLGRLSEVNGKQDIWKDLYTRLIIDSAEAVKDYTTAPAWLKTLLNAWADGLNYFLHTHPQVKPLLLSRFKPWYPLLWTDGSIGAISTGHLGPRDLEQFYSQLPTASANMLEHQLIKETLGSNGFAIAPSKSASGHAMLYINPHTTFYFRPEVQMVSEEGLHAYGAVTWGQFFIYQGFNPYCGWMHTSSNADVSDVYAEKIIRKDKRIFYAYESGLKPVEQKDIIIHYREGDGTQSKTFQTYRTHHGPIMGRKDDNTWLSVRSYNRARNSLEQSWLRTKAKGLEDYKKVMDMRGNTSNNTVFADNKGNIAYWHGNFMPIRDTAYNWGSTIDGSTRKTEWKGLHTSNETVQVFNPPNGWLQNCNSTPFTAAGVNSPKRSAYPTYMAPDGENFRGVNAVRVLHDKNQLTLDGLIAAGYDHYLPAFETLIPALKKWQTSDTLLSKELKEALDTLMKWDMYCGETSVATTLAIEWGQALNPLIQKVYIEQGESDQVTITRRFAETASRSELLNPLQRVVSELKNKFGDWRMTWGNYNRYQRLTGNIKELYDDAKPSIAVGQAPATWGCLPSFVSRVMPGTKKRYGVSGNSFVCAVEFGPRVRAKSVLAGGNNSDPSSPHFNDQANMYAKGSFKEVLFYRDEVLQHANRKYRPGL